LDVGSALLLGRYLNRATHIQKKRGQISVPEMVFEPTIPVFEWTKTFHASDRVATVIGR
jgi:hypothetical protein